MPEKTSVLPVRLIAMGSALGADQIGWMAVRRLDMAGITALHPERFLEIDICPSPALLVTQCFSARALILLDAYCSADPVGTVRHFLLGQSDIFLSMSLSHCIILPVATDSILARRWHYVHLWKSSIRRFGLSVSVSEIGSI